MSMRNEELLFGQMIRYHCIGQYVVAWEYTNPATAGILAFVSSWTTGDGTFLEYRDGNLMQCDFPQRRVFPRCGIINNINQLRSSKLEITIMKILRDMLQQFC